MVELTKELGFNNGAQTLDLLLSVIPQLMGNTAGKDIPPKLPQEQFEAPTFQHLRGDPGPSYSSQVQNNRILPGETSRQNYGNQSFYPSGICQAFRDVPVNPDFHHQIPAQSEFEVSDWRQHQNQGVTQMGGSLGRHRESLSKEEQKYVDNINKSATDKAPKM